MTRLLCIGGDAHGREIECPRDGGPLLWPVPLAPADIFPRDDRPLGVSPDVQTYTRRRLGCRSGDGRLAWRKEVLVFDHMGDWTAREALKELLLERFIQTGRRVLQ